MIIIYINDMTLVILIHNIGNCKFLGGQRPQADERIGGQRPLDSIIGLMKGQKMKGKDERSKTERLEKDYL